MFSRVAYFSCAALILYVAVFFYPKWENEAGESSLGWDAATYYWYLPSAFIYQDLKSQSFSDSIIEKYQFVPSFEQFIHENGNVVITYSSGLALVHLPAFLVAHLVANPLGFPADGFSLPYQIAVQLWSLFFALLGLWYFRKLLLRYYSDRATAITLVLLVFGTNYLNYSGVDVTLTHSWLFSIYTLTMLNTDLFFATKKRRYALRVGLLVGLAILIRPSEIIVILLPLLWGMNRINVKAIKRQIGFMAMNYRAVLLAIVSAMLVASIQVAYWLYVADTPLVYSYGDKSFSWTNPHFSDFTFSYRSGWMVYTPLMLFVFPALLY